MEVPIWQFAVAMSAYFIFLLFLVEIMRKNPRLSFVFWILSLLTFPLWSDYLEGWFRWVKTVSVLIPTALIVGPSRIAEITKIDKFKKWIKFYKKDWVLWSLYLVLGLNIFEASMKDFAADNCFNAIVGLILMATMPVAKYIGKKADGWKISNDSKGEVIAYTHHIWNFLYTTWNIVFVYDEHPGFVASSICILLAAELYPVIKGRPELYVTSRIYTLAFHILIRANGDPFSLVMDSTSWHNNSVVYYWGMINLIIAIPYFIWHFNNRRKELMLEKAVKFKKVY